MAPDSPATAGRVRRLVEAGLIPPARFDESLAFVRDHGFWQAWAGHVLLALGMAQLLAGVVCFFAYNWAELGRLEKLGAAGAGVVVAVLGAAALGSDSAGGKACRFAAAVLVGVLLAVMGQVYQSGADAWLLFALWAALIVPWVATARAAAEAALFVAVLQAAFWFWADQVAVPEGWITDSQRAALAGLGMAGALAFRETAVRAGRPLLVPAWTRLSGLAAGLAILTLTASGEVLGGTIGWDEASVIVLLLLALAGALAYYRRAAPDFAALSIVVLAGLVFASAVAAEVILGPGNLLHGLDDSLGALLLLALALALLGAGAWRLLLHLREGMPRGG